ncbi:MAG: SDR family oxidoreductase, partial [Candidatus Eiseniibacteriota bacterium]
ARSGHARATCVKVPPMRILVTGGAGFIGSNLADRLVALGHDVAVLDDLSTGRRENLPQVARFFEADIRDAAAVEAAVASFRPEIVSHHAAQIDVRRSVREPALDAHTNVLGGIALFEACVRHGVRKVIYASTGGALYGEGRTLPATEEHPIHPESPYGISKYALEHYLHFYRLVHGLDSTVLRYPNVFGPRQSPHGEAGVNAIFIGLMLEGKRPTIFGDGEQLRDYVYVDDVVRANELALGAGSGETVNIGWGRGISVNDIVRTLRKLLAFEDEPIYADARPGEIQRIYLDAARARRVLGWEPQVSFEEGLGRTVAWHRTAAATS